MPSIRLIAVCLVLVGVAGVAQARPPHKKAMADHLGKFLPKKLNDCILCHLPDRPDAKEEDEKPHNLFGTRLISIKEELKKTGKKTDLVSRFEAIAGEDTDGDGVGNLLEILVGRNPGDKADAPTAEEGTEAKTKLAALEQKRKDYAWRPFDVVKRPALPIFKNKGWVRNPIDAFIAHEHEKHGLTPRPEAPRHVLLRRLYLDLIGLPPTPDDIVAFEKDASPDAYEKIVDRLLASPHYGERWGRHWMDVWRYTDWHGYGAEVRNSQPHIWRWRDWIIESLNEDKPYDRMIQEMLAGDEIAPTDPKTLRATGFLVRNWYKFNRDVWLDHTVEHTAKAFLGLTVNCARCHDHFFDPIPQTEYYQFRAFFEPHDVRTDRVPGQVDTKIDGLVRVFDARPATPTYLYVRGEDKNPDKKNPLQPGVLSALGGAVKIEPIKLPPEAVAPEKQPWVVDQLAKDATLAVDRAADALAKTKEGSPERDLATLTHEAAKARQAAIVALLKAEKLEQAQPKSPAFEAAAKETLKAQREANLHESKRDVALAERATKDPKTDKKLSAARIALKKAEEALAQPLTTAYTRRPMTVYPESSTGRRLALAKWIANDQNPLTARVAVNHLWLRHFGKALVPSVFDFGGNGQPPTHPALLDWLAAEFMASDAVAPAGPWSMKRLHRLMVTSAAYRMDSTTDAANAAKDEDNRYLWRMNTRRMEAEIVRDSVLSVAGQLDRTMGGPEVEPGQGLAGKRRSVYYRHAPEKMVEFLTLFDNANVSECYQRTESVVPHQALAMANSSLVLANARLLARGLNEKIGKNASGADFIHAGFQHVLCRPATAEEIQACERFLESQKKLLADAKSLTTFTGGAAPLVPAATDPALRAREDLIHVLLNHNEFVTIR